MDVSLHKCCSTHESNTNHGNSNTTPHALPNYRQVQDPLICTYMDEQQGIAAKAEWRLEPAMLSAFPLFHCNWLSSLPILAQPEVPWPHWNWLHLVLLVGQSQQSLPPSLQQLVPAEPAGQCSG